ncbi:hypothetical protein GSF04_00675 [Pseudoalteromonas sp. A22]|uniref:hypothetical protein n=1 Tax=Pseudoalteromonas sp. A22 TaxID=327511 RepID=UPI001BAD1CF7|nr:hypothetical protein [Pseudoalteromonas sp. A22]QUI61087.1 hypothetical protein GSF04_00675 [Pseudoalteromonas sp. A22]
MAEIDFSQRFIREIASGLGFGGGIAAGTAIVVFLAKNVASNIFKRDIEKYKSGLKLRELDYNNKVEIKKQLEAIVRKYSGKILLSASDLQDRLWHVCQRQSNSKNPVLLVDDDSQPMYGAWPMTKKHYLSSTLYMFARYFYWVESLKTEFSYLDFGDDSKTNEFNYYLKKIERALADTDIQKYFYSRVKVDRPIFQFMQTEIGEHLAQDSAGCMSYKQFLSVYDELIKSSESFAALKELLILSQLKQSNNFTLTRLRVISNALCELIYFLNKERALISPDQFEKVKLTNFKVELYEKDWPHLPKA